MKNAAAVELAKARAAKLTPDRRSQIARNAVKVRWERVRRLAVKEYLSEQGKKGAAALTRAQRSTAGKAGGTARGHKLLAKRRREIARNAANARWEKARENGKCKVS